VREGLLRNWTKKARCCKVKTALRVTDRKRRLEMRKDDCIFCKIANGEIPSTEICENEGYRVILDLGPASKGHALVLPKEHYDNITEMPEQAIGEAFSLAGKVGKAMQRGLGAAGFNLVQNNGTAAGQTVFHFHIHIIPRYENGPEMVAWTPGKAEPEELKATAESIRKAL